MNFPIDQPLLQWIYWLLNSPGIGGAIVALFSSATVLSFTLVFLWIRQGAFVIDDEDIYTHPTPGLHRHDEGLE